MLIHCHAWHDGMGDRQDLSIVLRLTSLELKAKLLACFM